MVDRLTKTRTPRLGDKNSTSMMSQRKYKTSKNIGNGRLMSSKLSSSNIKTPSELESATFNEMEEPKSPTFSK